MALRFKDLNIVQIAKIADFYEDPYGDRNKDNFRMRHQAAIRILRNEAMFGDEQIVRECYMPIIKEHFVNKDGKLNADVMRNNPNLENLK